MNIRFFTFEAFHGKQGIGSTNIRVHQLIKNWNKIAPEDDVGLYHYGENPDVLIFQKVYCLPDYKFPIHFPGIKILDVCDPDWLEGAMCFAETVDAVDATVCSSDRLTKFIQQLTDKPVTTIKDRFDLDVITLLKQHKNDARTIVWFGYRHNAETLKPAMQMIHELGLNLLIIADDDPFAWQWLFRDAGEEFRKTRYSFVKYREETIYYELAKADFCIFPRGRRPIDEFKSNNKTIKAILAGLPVATDGYSLKDFVIAQKRQKWLEEHYKKAKEDYNCLKSVQEYKELINRLKST